MSVSLWRWSEECDGRACPGDCDGCTENEETEKLYVLTFGEADRIILADGSYQRQGESDD